MSKLYKLISVLFIVSLILAACGGDDDAGEKEAEPVAQTEQETKQPQPPAKAEKVHLVMTNWGSQLDPEVYQARLDLFMAKEPNIEVELLYIPSDYTQKVQTMIAGGEAPCIMQLAEDVHGYSGKGMIIALDEYIEQYGIDVEARYGTTGGLVGAYSRDGHLYAMPDRGGALILYYNKDMFDAAGVSYPTKEWTWDDFLSAAQALTIRDGDDVEVYGFAAGGWWPWWMTFIYMNGGAILDEGGNPVTNSPEAVEAMKFYNDLVFEYKVAPSPEDYANMGQGSPDPLFAQGKTAMNTTGFWGVGGLASIQDLNWDIAPMFMNTEPATVLFGSGLAISRECKHPEEAFKAIEFLTSAEGQMPIAEMKQDAPANIDALRSDAFLNAGWAGGHTINMQALADSAEMAFPLPLSPQWNEMLTIFDDNLSEFFLGKGDAQDVMDTIQEQLEVLFSE